MSFPPNGNYFNVFHCFLGHVIFRFGSSVTKFQVLLCIALLFSSFYGVVFEVFSSLTAAVARLF